MTEEKNAGSYRVGMRLPRLGCFFLFLLFFMGAGLLSTVLIETLLYKPPAWEPPEGTVFIGDREGILLEDDGNELRKQAEAVAELGRCRVAVMFVDETTAPFPDILRQVASEWHPEKGVLLLFGTRNRTVRLQLLGEGWQLAGWNGAKAAQIVRLYPSSQRGALAADLLKRLKDALEEAAKISGPAARDRSPVLVSEGEGAKEEDHPAPAVFALFAAGLSLGFGLLLLKKGRETLRHLRQKNPEIEAEYRRRVAEKPRLELVDLNRPKSGWMHAKGARITAIVLGLLFGLAPLSQDPVPPDAPIVVDSALPEDPDGRVVDCAGVFSPEDKQMLEEAIARAERATGGEIMVLAVDTVGKDRSLEEFSLETASAWQIGKKGRDNGALLLLAIEDRKNRLEIGYGWEGPINDAKAGDLLRAIVPDLRAEKYAEAAAKVVAGIEQAVTGTAPGESPAPKPPVLTAYPTKAIQAPAHDPRKSDPAASAWAIFGIVATLAGIALGYRGRLLATAEPHWIIYDPDEVRHSSSGGSGSGSRSYSCSSYDSDSGSSSSSSSGSRSGGGSFGGGGASGSW